MLNSKFSYITLSGSTIHNIEHKVLYNKIYNYWRNFWFAFWKNSTQTSNTNSLGELFHRQSVVNCILFENNPVGLVLQTFYDLSLDVTFDLPYFSHYSQDILDTLKTKGFKTIVTHEYLTVDSDWRKTKRGFSLSPILMSLGSKIMKELNGDVSIAIARKDLNIHKLCYSLGWETLLPNVVYKGFPCDIISLESSKAIMNNEVKDTVEDLWNKRICYIKQNYTERFQAKQQLAA